MRGKVSLIIPIYNAAKYLSRTLCTILAQDYSNIEIVAVNDASTDESERILQEFAEKFKNRGFSCIIVTRKINGGLCAAINDGLKASSGEYLCFPDADDELSQDYVSAMVQVLEEDKSAGWVRCNYTIVLEEENREYDVILPEKSVYKNDYYDFISKFIPHNAWNMMVTRQYFEKCVGKQIFDSRLTQEWSLLLPLSYHSNYKRCNGVLYKYYIRKGAMSSWQKGKIESVISHFNDLKELNIEVLKLMEIPNADMELSIKALEIYYSLAKVKKYVAGNRKDEVGRELRTLKMFCDEIISWNVAENMHNYDLYVRFVFDVLLEMHADIPEEFYYKYKEMFASGYMVYIDRAGEKLLTSICAAFGKPIEVIDCSVEERNRKYSDLAKACLVENSSSFLKLVEKDLKRYNLYVDYRILRDALRGWAFVKGGQGIEQELDTVC